MGTFKGVSRVMDLTVGRLLSVSSTILCGVTGWNKKGERETDPRGVGKMAPGVRVLA